MDVSLYQSAAAMNATERWQDMVAENLSVASVPGARQHEISFSAVQAGLAGAGQNYVMPQASTLTNFQQGELRATGNNLDFAVQGPGFFTVQLPDGSPGYTRDGEFTLNSTGQLVTKKGYPVTSASGALQFDLNNPKPISVNADGEVSQGTDIKGKLQLAEFSQPQKLTELASGYFSTDDPKMQPLPAANTKVAQGSIEAANTSPTLEMASLVTAMRMFESNQKVMTMQSDRMSKTITDLGGS
jgi:flagellar basal body rod protein FlgG